MNEADDPGRTGPSSCFIFYFSPLLSLYYYCNHEKSDPFKERFVWNTRTNSAAADPPLPPFSWTDVYTLELFDASTQPSSTIHIQSSIPPLSLVKVSVRAPLSQFLLCNGRHTKCLCVYTYWWIITCEKNFCEGSCFGFCSSLNLQCWLWQIEYSNELLILQRWEIARNSKEKICLAEMDWSSATFFKNWVFLKRTSHAQSFFFFLFVFLFAQWKQSTDKVE